jgi:hypothetical protein
MKTHILCSVTFFPPENRTVYEIMSKNVVETEGPQMTSQYGAYALRAGKTRLHSRMRTHTTTPPGTHTHARTRMNTQTSKWFLLLFHSNSDSQTRLDVTSYVHCLSCQHLISGRDQRWELPVFPFEIPARFAVVNNQRGYVFCDRRVTDRSMFPIQELIDTISLFTELCSSLPGAWGSVVVKALRC